MNIIIPNTTISAVTDAILPGPLSGIMKALSALVGGVFGIYLIILYLKWKEYIMLKKMMLDIRRDIHKVAFEQGVSLPPIKEPKMFKFMHWFKRQRIKHQMKKDLEDQDKEE